MMTLIPYTKKDGAWNLPDEVLIWAYGKMIIEGLADMVFFDGSIQSVEHFLNFFHRPDIDMHLIITEEGDLAGMAWLSGYVNGHANVHCVSFKAIHGRTKEAGKMSIDYWFGVEVEGNKLINVLIGIFPDNYRWMRMFVKRLGFKVIGSIPSIFYIAKENKMIGATISYLERGQ